ncbi:MAG TPA: hypothetical protein VKD90_01395 [Gemmataceae bacterium]|nr:hypothetical protein [Gemmataceae bacterium]
MLPLESERWQSLRTFFGESKDLPDRIRRWLKVAGRPEADPRWRDFAEQYLHQTTITDAAYAVVPYLASALDRFPPPARLAYVINIACVESAVQKEYAPQLPDDLAGDYRSAVEHTRGAAAELLPAPWSKPEFVGLVAALCCLHGHDQLGDILFDPYGAVGRCPECRRYVFPENLQLPEYRKW